MVYVIRVVYQHIRGAGLLNTYAYIHVHEASHTCMYINMLVPVLYNNKKIYIAAAIIIYIYIYSISIFTVFRVPGTWPDMIPGISIVSLSIPLLYRRI